MSKRVQLLDPQTKKIYFTHHESDFIFMFLRESFYICFVSTQVTFLFTISFNGLFYGLVQTQKITHTYTDINRHTHTDTQTHMHVITQIHRYAFTQTHKQTQEINISLFSFCLPLYISLTHAHIHTCRYIHTHMYSFIHIHSEYLSHPKNLVPFCMPNYRVGLYVKGYASLKYLSYI